MGRVEIDDRGCNFLPDVAGNMRSRQTRFETPHQSFMDGLTLGQHPDAKRRIEIVQSFEQPLVKLLDIEQQRMDAPAFGELKHALDIDFDLTGVDADQKPLGDEAPIARLLEHRTQFSNDLAQRGACLFLVRTAPQQADQPFPALLLHLRQRKVAEHGAGLAGSQFDRPAVELQAEASDQRHQ